MRLQLGSLVEAACRYPKIVKDCIEEVPEAVDGVEVPVDTSGINPNGIEFDNLYLASPS